MKSISCLPLILIVSGVFGSNPCVPGWYGELCDKRCNAKCRPHSDGITYCQKHSGGCLLGCVPGWYGEKCIIPCSKNCIDDVCNQQTGQCTEGCKGNYRGAMCDVYEVSGVFGSNPCVPGWYGELCDKRCNAKCRSHSDGITYCKKHSGGCLLGCVPGWYSEKCIIPCSKNCIDDVCNQQTGQCTKGCKKSYRGAMCDVYEVSGVSGSNPCEPGLYGELCDKRCNAKCRPHSDSNIYCEKHSGGCLSGCVSGWYSEKCIIPCSKNCIGDVCNQQTGQCTKGCKGNYRGAMCDVIEVTRNDPPPRHDPPPSDPQTIDAPNRVIARTGTVTAICFFGSLFAAIIFALFVRYICRKYRITRNCITRNW